MKKLFLIIFLSAFIGINAQDMFSTLKQNEGMLGGGTGVTWIDGQPYYHLRLFPEFAFSNFGIGLDFKIEVGSNGKIRSENFNEFSDYLSIIRYVRYGQKGDPFYARLGALDYATLGHGSIMYAYNNSPSYDKRTIGLALDADFSEFGFESVYSSFGESGVLGIRGYVRPLRFTDLGSIPIIGSLEVGATYTGDLNDNSGVLAGNIDPLSGNFVSTRDTGSVNIIGLDLGLPIVRTSAFNLDLYFDYVKILDFGSGTTAGLKMGFNGLGLVDVMAKLERRFNGDNYIPSYFSSLYELERFQVSGGAVNSKVQQLLAAQSVGNGFYGELLVSLLGTFDIVGSYQRLDNDSKSGALHLATDVSPDDGSFIAKAGYDKVRIQGESDMFKLDDRSYFFIEFGYKPMSYMIVSMVYHWTYTPVRDADDNVIDYAPQKKIEPRISFVMPLDF
ncbi:MAG: hypothetical protein K9J12_08160 [Melioribacteraceae bacterium]|nr:hypothetical protein [Melioribacteraceae bacterium]MCF8264102.1 hypothetical protein [Melioribacteraceae bacterium]MCF8432751.1 hypothetical protein [Melioribacteraceae bacterium]